MFRVPAGVVSADAQRPGYFSVGETYNCFGYAQQWNQDLSFPYALCPMPFAALNFSSRMLIKKEHHDRTPFVVSQFVGTLGCQLILNLVSNSGISQK